MLLQALAQPPPPREPSRSGPVPPGFGAPPPPPPSGPRPPAGSAAEAAEVTASAASVAAAVAAVAAEAVQQPDEYERYGPPPSLAALVRDSYEALQHAATSTTESSAGLPPEWRRINVMYPPYAMQQQQGGEGGEGREGAEREGLRGDEERVGTGATPMAGGASLYGPMRPPRR